MKSNTKTIGKRKSRRPRTTVLLTMINMFLGVIGSRTVLGSLGFVMYHTSRIRVEVSKLQIDRAISEFHRSRIFHGGDILMKILIFSTFSKKIKIEKESMKEKEVNRERGGACSTSYPSGNQVDGLPLVAVEQEILLT